MSFEVNGNLAVTGQVILGFDPTQNLQSATKQYVDTRLGGLLPVSGGTLTGPLYLSGNPTQSSQAANKAYIDASLAAYLPLSGGNLTGALLLSANPSVALGAATKQYVDSSILGTINLGSGQAIYAGVSGGANTFKSLVAGGNITLTSDGNTITINAASGGGSSLTISNEGIGTPIYDVITSTPTNALFKTLIAGPNVTIGVGSTALTISAAVAETFTQLTDVPQSYVGFANNPVIVNPSATGLEFASTVFLSNSGAWYGNIDEIDPKVTDYTVVPTDSKKYIGINSVASQNITLPDQLETVLPIGYTFRAVQLGLGTINLVVSGLDVLNGLSSTLEQFDVLEITLMALNSGTNTWVVKKIDDIDITQFAKLNAVNTFTAGQAISPIVLTFGASTTIVPNMANSNNFEFTMTGDVVVDAPINSVAGQDIEILMIQDAIGGHSFVLNPIYDYDNTTPINTNPNSITVLSGYVSETGPIVLTIRDDHKAYTNRVNVFTKGQAIQPQRFVTSGSPTPDFSETNNFEYVMTGDLSIPTPANITAGEMVNLIFIQDGVGGHNVSLAPLFVLPPSPIFSSEPSAADWLQGYCATDGKIYSTLRKGT